MRIGSRCSAHEHGLHQRSTGALYVEDAVVARLVVWAQASVLIVASHSVACHIAHFSFVERFCFNTSIIVSLLDMKSMVVWLI